MTLLLQKGCDVDSIDKSGRTPLFFALKHSFAETCRVLLQKGTLLYFLSLFTLYVAGANPHLKDNAGVSPYDIAEAFVKTIVDVAIREREKLKDVELQKKFQLATQKFNTKFKEVHINGLKQEILYYN